MNFYIPNGCFDAYEVKVNKDIFKYQGNVKQVPKSKLKSQMSFSRASSKLCLQKRSRF